MERTGERTHERALPRRFLRAGRGQGAQTPPPRPAPPPPLSSSATKSLTDADHFGMIRTAQRRFAPTVIGITRNSDRHEIGMSDRHRRNTQRYGLKERERPARSCLGNPEGHILKGTPIPSRVPLTLVRELLSVACCTQEESVPSFCTPDHGTPSP